MRCILPTLVVTLLAAPLAAESMLDRLKQGAGKVGDAAGKGIEVIGDGAEKGLDAVGDAVNSTNELVRNEETPEETRAKLDRMADTVLAQLLAENEQARETLQASSGYAVFDMRRVSVFPLAAGYGRGVAISMPGEARTYMQMGTGGVGAAFGIGGFESQFVIMFETPEDFDSFVTEGLDASADAGLMEGENRTATQIQFLDGRSFFVLDRKGWRVNANASGTKYWKDAALN